MILIYFLNKYNVLMENSTKLHILFIKLPHFLLESCVPLWPMLDEITFPLMSNCLGATWEGGECVFYFDSSWGNYIALRVGSWIILIHGGLMFPLCFTT
jgi:hypothetical protein